MIVLRMTLVCARKSYLKFEIFISGHFLTFYLEGNKILQYVTLYIIQCIQCVLRIVLSCNLQPVKSNRLSL